MAHIRNSVPWHSWSQFGLRKMAKFKDLLGAQKFSQSSESRRKIERSQARLKPFNLESLKHKYVAKMPSGYLNHPLPVSVLSLCFGEGPKMLHSLWPCFLHLKRIYTAGVLTSRRKKKGTYFGCQILNVLTLSKKNTLLCYQWVRENWVQNTPQRLPE